MVLQFVVPLHPGFVGCYASKEAVGTRSDRQRPQDVPRNLEKLLESGDDITVVGEASTGNECVLMLAKFKPDILLLDLGMPNKHGSAAVLEQFDLNSLATRVIVLTADDGDAVRAMRLGARGLFFKQSASDLLLKSIRCVFSGQIWLDNRITAQVMRAFARSSNGKSPADKRLRSGARKTGRATGGPRLPKQRDRREGFL